MKVIFYHNGVLPVKKYGGIERILFWHMKELAKTDIEVILIGNPKNDKSILKKYKIQQIDCHDFANWKRLIPKDTSIVHLFFSDQLEEYPLIVSMGCNGQIAEQFHKNSVFVSKQHAKNHNSSCFVYNGVDFSEYPHFKTSVSNWNTFCFLAKARWSVKNVKDCIKVCKNRKKTLLLMGGRSWPSRFVKSFGLVDTEKKIQILNNSDALLFPVRWHEPFGIAVIEAMSQGRPVIGSNFGSLPELITRESGIICNNYTELENALTENHQFNSEEISEYARKNFCISKFTLEYIKLYQKILKGQELNQIAPEWNLKNHPTKLLKF